MTTQTVAQEQDPDRFEITVDGTVAGAAQFVDEGSQRIFFHTKISDEFGGRGLAGAVVNEALQRTRAEGLRVVPVCPYVANYVTKHPEFADLVDEVTDEAIALAARTGS